MAHVHYDLVFLRVTLDPAARQRGRAFTGFAKNASRSFTVPWERIAFTCGVPVCQCYDNEHMRAQTRGTVSLARSPRPQGYLRTYEQCSMRRGTLLAVVGSSLPRLGAGAANPERRETQALLES